MAKFVIKANGELETLTQPELDKSLANMLVSWRAEVGRGVGFRRFIRQGTADATGAVVLGGSDSSASGLGPRESMVWGIVRMNVSNLVTAGTVIVRCFVNSTQEGDMVKGNFVNANNSTSHEFGGPGLVLRPGDVFLVTATGLTVGTVVTLTGSVTEVPFNNAYALL